MAPWARAAALLALFAGVPPRWWSAPCFAMAEGDEVQVEDDSKGSEGADAGADAGGAEESPEAAAQKAQAYQDSAKELTDKLAQLRALLDAKGEDADPALKERLKGLQSQLSSLGIGDLGGGGDGEIPSSPELTEFLSGCVAMSMRRVGVKRPSTVGALKRLADDKLTPEEAAKVDLYRMIGVCVNEFTEEELTQFKAGKLSILPKAYVDAAKKPEAEDQVKSLDASIWKELKKIAAGLVRELVGDTAEQGNVPFYVGLVGAVPVILMVGFLARKFVQLQQEKAAAAEKKEKRGGKKSR